MAAMISRSLDGAKKFPKKSQELPEEFRRPVRCGKVEERRAVESDAVPAADVQQDAPGEACAAAQNREH